MTPSAWCSTASQTKKRRLDQTLVSHLFDVQKKLLETYLEKSTPFQLVTIKIYWEMLLAELLRLILIQVRVAAVVESHLAREAVSEKPVQQK